LKRHHVRGSEASSVERGEEYLTADTVKRGVHGLDVVGIDRGQGGDDGFEVFVDDARAHRLAAIAQRDLSQRPDLPDGGGDLVVGRRNDLGSVPQVDLVAVVLWRVVTGGDHHSCRAGEVADGEREQRSWKLTGETQHSQSRPGDHSGGFVGEALGAVTGVVADHDPRRGCAGNRVRQVGGEPRAGPPDGGHVHPGGSGTEGPA
jgi:hypothetical protein